MSPGPRVPERPHKPIPAPPKPAPVPATRPTPTPKPKEAARRRETISPALKLPAPPRPPAAPTTPPISAPTTGGAKGGEVVEKRGVAEAVVGVGVPEAPPSVAAPAQSPTYQQWGDQLGSFGLNALHEARSPIPGVPSALQSQVAQHANLASAIIAGEKQWATLNPPAADDVPFYIDWARSARASVVDWAHTNFPSIAPALEEVDTIMRENPTLEYTSMLGQWGAIWYYSPQILQHINKMPERLIFLANTYLPATFTLSKATVWQRTGRAITQDEFDRIVVEETALKAARQLDFERFVTNEDGTVNWGRMLGTFELDPASLEGGVWEAVIKNTGLTGIGFTFIRHPERLGQFIEAVERGDAGLEGGLTLAQAVIQYEDIGIELLGNMVIDPLNVAPPIVTQLLFPPAILIGPVLEKISSIVRPRRLLGAAMGTVREAGEYVLNTSWVKRISRRGLLINTTDKVNDALNTLLLRFDPVEHGSGIRFWQRVLLGDQQFMTDLGLGEGQRLLLTEMATRFNDAGLGQISDLAASRGGRWREMITEIISAATDDAGQLTDEAVQSLIDASLRDDPRRLYDLISTVNANLTAKAMGHTVIPRGALARTFQMGGQLLRESWLGGSMSFKMANTSANFANAAVTGNFINPFDVGAPARIATLFENFTEFGFPKEVVRDIILDTVSDHGGVLTTKIPIPLIGRPSEAIPAAFKFMGLRRPEKLIKVLREGPALVQFLDHFNWGTVAEASLEFSSRLEQTARAQVFYNYFEDIWPSKYLPDLVAAASNSPQAPPSVTRAIQRGQIRNISDIERLHNVVNAEGIAPTIHLADLAPDTLDIHNPHIAQLGSTLQDIEIKYRGNYDNPAFRDEITQSFAESQVAMGRDAQAIYDALRIHRPDLEHVQMLADADLGIFPPPRTDDALSAIRVAPPPPFETAAQREARLLAGARQAQPALPDIEARIYKLVTEQRISRTEANMIVAMEEAERLGMTLDDYIRQGPPVTPRPAVSAERPPITYIPDDRGELATWFEKRYGVEEAADLRAIGFEGAPELFHSAWFDRIDDLEGWPEGTAARNAGLFPEQMDLPARGAEGVSAPTPEAPLLAGARPLAQPFAEHRIGVFVNGKWTFAQDLEAQTHQFVLTKELGVRFEDVQAFYWARPGEPPTIQYVNGDPVQILGDLLGQGHDRAAPLSWLGANDIDGTIDDILGEGVNDPRFLGISGEGPFVGGVNIDLGAGETGTVSGGGREFLVGADVGPVDAPGYKLDLGRPLPFARESVDNYNMRNVLGFSDNPAEILETLPNEVHRTLKPGGRFTFYDDDAEAASVLADEFRTRQYKVNELSTGLEDEFGEELVGYEVVKPGRLSLPFKEVPAERIAELGIVADPTPEAFRRDIARINGREYYGIIDMDSGRVAYGPSDRTGGKLVAHQAELFGSIEVPTRGPNARTFVRTRDGRIQVMARDFNDLQEIAEVLKARGLPDNAILVATVPDWEGGRFAGSIREVLTGELDANTLTVGDVYKAEQAQSDFVENLRTETMSAYRRGLGQIDEWFQNVARVSDEGIREFERSAAEHAATRQWFDDFKAQWSTAQEEAVYEAAAEVHRILFDYASRGNIEEIIRHYGPFTTWQISNPMFWLQEFMRRPNLISAVLKTWREMEILRKRYNLTERFRGTVGGPIPPELGGGYLGVDARFAVPVFSQMQEPFEPIGWEGPEEQWQRILEWAIRSGEWIGVRPWPVLDWLMQKAGVLPERDIFKGLFGPLQRFAELVAMQNGVIEPWESLSGSVDSGTRNLWMYYINRRIVELEAEGVITAEQRRAATDNPGDPIWEQAKDDVINVQAIYGYASLVLPTRLKYATPGELTIRQEQAERAALPEFERVAFGEERPYLAAYGSLFVSPEERTTIEERESLFGELETLHPERDRTRREEIFTRLEEISGTRTQAWTMRGTFIAQAAGTRGQQAVRDEGDMFRYLNAMEPQASDFELENGEINWDAYEQAVETFRNTIIPNLSETLGFPMDYKGFQRWENRARDPLQLAFELNRERINEGFRLMESYQPGGENFAQASTNYVNSQYWMDVLSGFTAEQAAAHALDEWERIQIQGLPFDYEQRLLGKYIEEIPAEEMIPQIVEILGIDLASPEFTPRLAPLLNEELPGMFTAGTPIERARNNLTDYYYNLTPRERGKAIEALGVTLGEEQSFAGYVSDLSDEEARALATRVSGSTFTPRVAQEGPAGISARLGVLHSGVAFTALPPNDALTPQEQIELSQVERDWFLYNYSQEKERRPGEWTPLMEKYYGDPDSAQSRFWVLLGQYALKTDAFDDPTMGAFLNATARGGLDFSEAQYEWAIDWFQSHLDVFVDDELTQDLQDHPDWGATAELARAELRRLKDLDFEERKNEYYTLSFRNPGRGQPSPREEWEQANPEEWAELRRYINEQQAHSLAYPEYMYFFDHRDYVKWYGQADPTTIHEKALKLSRAYLQALKDFDAYRNGTGGWTSSMQTFIGPDPNAIPPESTGGGAGGGTSGGTSGGTQPQPTEQPSPVPTPPPFPTPPPPPGAQPSLGRSLVQQETRGTAAEAIEAGRVPERRFRPLAATARTNRVGYLFGDDVEERALKELKVSQGPEFTRELLGMVVDRGIAKGMQEDEAVEAFLNLIDPETASAEELAEKQRAAEDAKIVLDDPVLRSRLSSDFQEILDRVVLGAEFSWPAGGIVLDTITQHGQSLARLRPPLAAFVKSSTPGKAQTMVALHEAAHVMSRLSRGPSPHGDTPNTEAFQEAVEFVASYAPEVRKGKPWNTVAVLVSVFPGVGENPLSDMGEWTWGGYGEVYADIFAYSLGDPEAIPPILRPFYTEFFESLEEE